MSSQDPNNQSLKEGKDFYYDPDGKMVLTADYLFNRGYCCESGCRHCPYGYGQKSNKKKPQIET
ncbi:MAG: hypothetical protein IPJ69_08190 [Deltaproteobacteria bacterium]|nr:MAG: hypothetical protein IPJ69_08190 [Deltaproteobacteria bacterium]